MKISNKVSKVLNINQHRTKTKSQTKTQTRTLARVKTKDNVKEMTLSAVHQAYSSRSRSQGAVKHNTREVENHSNKNIRTDRSVDNLILTSSPLSLDDFINEIPAIKHKTKAYNDSQKRNDRKIKSYASEVFKNEKTNVVHEWVFQFGNANNMLIDNTLPFTVDDTLSNIDYKSDEWLRCEDALIEFNNRLPKLMSGYDIYSSVLHNDEATPHLHVLMVPNQVSDAKKTSINNGLAMVKSLESNGLEVSYNKQGKPNNRENFDTLRTMLDKELLNTFNSVNKTQRTRTDVKKNRTRLKIQEYKEVLNPITTRMNDIQELLTQLLESETMNLRDKQKVKALFDKTIDLDRFLTESNDTKLQEQQHKNQIDTILNNIDFDNALSLDDLNDLRQN